MTCLAGINLPTFGDAYNHDLAPNERYPDWDLPFTPIKAMRTAAFCRDMGFDALRIWLCENGEGIRTENGRIQGVMPELLQAIEIIQDGARIADLQLYWTLLDGNAWQRHGDQLTGQIASSGDVTEQFAKSVAQPIAAVLDPDITFALEVFNEPECTSQEVVGEQGLPWATIADSIRLIREAVKTVQPRIPVTSGTQAIFLPGLFVNGPPVDAVDIHVYHPTGGLPSRGDLPVDIGSLPLWAGECGFAQQSLSAEPDPQIAYLYNAANLGYKAAFLWQLTGDRPLVKAMKDPYHGGEIYKLTPRGGHLKGFLTGEWKSLAG
jgi:hypothetical protein